uniref:Uncharacterized protein n=1 Tax=Anopheles coluzzii TaxID=1518534 RepID=A0A8W7P6Z5_ANOCL
LQAPRFDRAVNLGNLLKRSHLAGADGPYRFVSDHVLTVIHFGQNGQLAENHVKILTSLTLGQGLTHAQHRDHPGRDRIVHLGQQQGIALGKILSALRVPNQRITTTNIAQHGGRHLASEGTIIGKAADILC